MTRPSTVRWLAQDHGNVAIWFALASLAIAGLGGGALTMTRLQASGSRLQDLADGAALAAAVHAQDSAASQADIEDAARRFGRDALTPGSEEFTTASMTVDVPKRAPAEVTVSLEQDVHTILAGFVGRDRITIRKRATAVSGPERKTCLLVLEPSAPSALFIQGNPELTAPDCMIQVNSTAPAALHAWGSPTAVAEATHVAGPAAPLRLRNWSAAPRFGQSPRPDPLAPRISWPSTDAPCVRPPANAAVLGPGVYCEGLSFTRDARLEPGLYVIQKGGLEVRRGLTGEGVTLVLLDPAGAFDVGGPAKLKLSAPRSGPWAGVAVAARPGAGVTTSRFGSNSQFELDGALYLPGHELVMQGSPSLGGAAANRALIVRRLTLQGAPDLRLAGGYPSGVYGAVRLSR